MYVNSTQSNFEIIVLYTCCKSHTLRAPHSIQYNQTRQNSLRRSLERETIARRVSVQLRIEHLQHVGQRQILAPIRLATNRPGHTFVFDQHLQQVGGQRAVAGGQRIADRAHHIDVAGSQSMHGPRNSRAARTRSAGGIAEERFVWRKWHLHFLTKPNDNRCLLSTILSTLYLQYFTPISYVMLQVPCVRPVRVAASDKFEHAHSKRPIG